MNERHLSLNQIRKMTTVDLVDAMATADDITGVRITNELSRRESARPINTRRI